MSDELHYQRHTVKPAPITPHELSSTFDQFKDDCKWKCVEFINGILQLDDSKAWLALGNEVTVRDSSNYAVWRVGCHDAVQMFVDAGWVVKETGRDFGINNNFEFSLKAAPNAE